jgi:5-methylcytosine-specific restriction endonuclease McrA
MARCIEIGKKKRQQVWEKTEGHCAYCGIALTPRGIHAASEFCIDHIDARTHGVNHDLDNLAPACRTCNEQKWKFSLEEYRKRFTQRGRPCFTKEHIAHLESLGLILPPDFPCYPRYLFWFEHQGINL